MDTTCVNETDFDECLKSNPTMIAALSAERKAIAKLVKRKPGDQELGKHEQ